MPAPAAIPERGSRSTCSLVCAPCSPAAGVVKTNSNRSQAAIYQTPAQRCRHAADRACAHAVRGRLPPEAEPILQVPGPEPKPQPDPAALQAQTTSRDDQATQPFEEPCRNSSGSTFGSKRVDAIAPPGLLSPPRSSGGNAVLEGPAHQHPEERQTGNNQHSGRQFSGVER